jgi:hypothetical protein
MSRFCRIHGTFRGALLIEALFEIAAAVNPIAAAALPSGGLTTCSWTVRPIERPPGLRLLCLDGNPVHER